MPDRPKTTETARSRPLPAAAFIAWVGLPSAVVVALAMDVRFASAWPAPAARWAVESVLIVQVVLSSLIFPRLLGRVTRWAASAGLAGALLAGATVVSGTPLAATALAWAWLTIWLGGLNGLAVGIRGRVGGILVPGLVAAALAGVYLQAEAGQGGLVALLPLPVRGSTFLHGPVWTAPAAVILVAAGAGISNYFSTRRRRPPEGNRFSTR